MSTEPVTGRVDEGSGTTAAFPVALKKILEIPPPDLLSCDNGELILLGVVWCVLNQTKARV